MRFELKAIGPGGAVEALDFQAPDEVTAVRQVEGRGYTVLSVRAKGSLGLPWRKGGERFPVALFSQELRWLLNPGLPLPGAIDTLAQKEKRGDWRGVIERLGEVLREGQTFSSALEEFPQTFSPLYVATVRSSEKTSDLAPALGRYVAYAAQLEAIKKRVVNASIYPTLLIAVGGIVSLFLLLYVVPRFGRIYEERGSALPLFSRLLLTWGGAVDKHAPVVLSVLGGLIFLGAYALRLASVRTAIGDALWRLPALGERLKMYQLARFYRTIGMLLRGGTPPSRRPRGRTGIAADAGRSSKSRCAHRAGDVRGGEERRHRRRPVHLGGRGRRLSGEEPVRAEDQEGKRHAAPRSRGEPGHPRVGGVAAQAAVLRRLRRRKRETGRERESEAGKEEVAADRGQHRPGHDGQRRKRDHALRR